MECTDIARHGIPRFPCLTGGPRRGISTVQMWLFAVSWLDPVADFLISKQIANLQYRDGSSTEWRIQRGTWCCRGGRSRKYTAFIPSLVTFISDFHYRVCGHLRDTVQNFLVSPRRPNSQAALFWLKCAGMRLRGVASMFSRRSRARPVECVEPTRTRDLINQPSLLAQILGLVSQLTGLRT